MPHFDNTIADEARAVVYTYVKEHLEKTDTHVTFEVDEVYVVWFAKTLKNWKALVSTTLPDGMYYEVTYNGYKLETYLDAYKKFENVVIPDPRLPVVMDIPPKTEVLPKLSHNGPNPRDLRWEGAHSRACGIKIHPHGEHCSRDCPTCNIAS